MPTYFNKFYPSSQDYSIRISSKAPYINFNQKTKSNGFLPPGIGQTKFIVNYYYRNNDLPKSFNSNFQDFLRQWDKIHEIRNKAERIIKKMEILSKVSKFSVFISQNNFF